jgi:hypothetical protein
VFVKETEPRSIDNVGNRVHTHSKIGIEANRLQHSFASDVFAVWKPANRGVVAINGKMLLPVFVSDVAHGVLLLDQLEDGNKSTCQLLKGLVLNTTARGQGGKERAYKLLAAVPVASMEIDD